MSWLQLIIEAQPSQIAAIQDYLDAAGALAVTLEDAGDEPLYEPPPGASPLWTQTRVVGLFPADARMETVVKGLGESLGAMPPHRLCALADRNWTRTWLDHFHPMQFGERLWVCPSGYDAPDPTAATVYLDPGLAFGTGTHPTTALCLEWLDANPPRGLEAVDYGCGSGILALAALRLGASHVWAVDNDPQALLATADNARKNGIRCHDMRQSPPWRPAAGSPAAP